MARKWSAAFSLVAAVACGGAQSPPGEYPVSWWVGTVSHAGESRQVYLHFIEKDGRHGVRFTIPEIGAEDAPLSWVEVHGNSVEMSSIGWVLQKEDGGRKLVGTMPPDLVPNSKLPVEFVRIQAFPPHIEKPSGDRAPPPVAWEASVGSPVYAGLAFDPARKLVIVAADSGTVTAFRAEGGARAWSIDAAAPIRATPLVAGGAIYVPTDKALLKLGAATGRRLWSASLGQPKSERLEIDDGKSRWDHYSSSAVIAGNTVFVGSRDGCVYRFRAGSGARLGRYCATDLVTATPVVARNRVYFASFDKQVYAADVASGRIVWKQDMGGEIPRDLALAGGKLLAGSRSYDLAALDPATGRRLWNRYYWFSWVDAAPNVVGNTVYIGASDGLRVYALDAASGGKRWESRLGGWTWARPAVGRATVYASITGTAMPYIGPRAGGFAAIDKASGRLRWLVPSAKPEKAAVYGFASAPLVANGMVYAAGLDGRVLAFRDE